VTLLSTVALGKGLQYRLSGFRISLRHRGTAMDLDAFEVTELVHGVWELRQTALQLGESSGTKFLCPNCQQLKPFAGDQALEYYNNACGVVLVCNDCLLDFHIRRGIERVKQM
jgi:hypothetical protein